MILYTQYFSTRKYHSSNHKLVISENSWTVCRFHIFTTTGVTIETGTSRPSTRVNPGFGVVRVTQSLLLND